ncbi:MAG: DNA translocase FtsK [Verrucomicrobiales bacterium]|nr:DNA translocase FtsK [Verrucomicrobiales bacterium]
MAGKSISSPTSPTSAPRARRRGPSRDQNAPTGPYPFHEGVAIVMGGMAVMLFLALVSYTPRDLPSWVPFSVTATEEKVVTNFIGPLGAIVAGWLYFIFGAASYLLPAVIAWWGVQVLTGARPFHSRNYLALAALVISAASLIEYQSSFFHDWPQRYNLPRSAGGFFGYLSTFLESRGVGTVGACIVTSVTYAVSLIVITGIHPFRFARMVRDRIQDQIERRHEIAEALAHRSRQLIRKWGDEGVEAAAMATRGAAGGPVNRGNARRSGPREKVVPAPEFDPSPVPSKVEEMELPLEPSLPEPKIIDASQPKRKADGEVVIDASALFAQHRKKKKEDKADGVSLISSTGSFENYELPSLDILRYTEPGDTKPTDTHGLLDLQRTIIDTLATFGVEVSPGDITKGPTITRYEVYPKPGLRVSRITSLEADLARATKAERIHILAPIPGKDTVGIEIANSDKVLVTLRELFEDDAFCKSKARIPLALGKDVYGHVIVGDLASMPHLLVAGATGSGKSVCINSIVASLLYRFTPDELRFIMIDPKVVEMQLYNKLPHMVIPVVTDPKKVLLALRWVINEMERRYAMFAKLGTRNFDGFNSRNKAKREAAAAAAESVAAPAKSRVKSTPVVPAEPLIIDSLADEAVEEELAEPVLAAHAVKINDDYAEMSDFHLTGSADDGDEEDELIAAELSLPPRGLSPAGSDEDEVPDHLPYIIVIIDELADLMQTAPADVETAIARIAQKARAAGIHLIVATQTPRADVVTGIIKANIPSRIAFQVSSKIDSRVILDAPGADRLVGKGDMLYLPPGCSQLVRAQGALILDDEIQDVVEACASQGGPQFESGIQKSIDGEGGEDDEEISEADEDMLEKCLEVVLQEKKASTSLLQRRLRLGYTRAARMIDILEQRGFIGPGDGAKPREILVDLSDSYE